MRSAINDKNFLIIECDCYEGEGRKIILPNNTILTLCEKCYKALRIHIVKEIQEGMIEEIKIVNEV
jgi:hypothetical protein